MPWSHPARAHARDHPRHPRHLGDWNNGTKLDFQGDFYTHTLMTPFFNPGPNPHGDAKISLAGVGELMTEVAGEVCDGFLCHGFTTERYLREVTLPALERGAAKAGRTLADFEISGPGLRGHRHRRGGDGAPIGRHQAADRVLRLDARRTAAVLELHGWGGLQDELNKLSKQGKWEEMGDLITDEILHTFAVVAEPEKLAAGLEERYGDIVHRTQLLRALCQRPGSLARGHGAAQGRLSPSAHSAQPPAVDGGGSTCVVTTR